LNGSKAVTSGSALVFDATNTALSVGGAALGTAANRTVVTLNATTSNFLSFGIGGTRVAHFYSDANEFAVANAAGASGFITFQTNSAERARFNATGALVFAGGTTTANGIGITFPATQSASTDANTLDDYEEGTYGSSSANGILTPSTSGSITCASDFSCSYTKIGRQVVCQGLITVSSVSSPVGFIKIALPFAQLSAANALGCGTFISADIDLPAGAVSNGLTSQTGGVTFCWPRVSVDNASYANVNSALLIVGSQIQFTFSFITS
jgi:hypothetical protein